ncbi:MAG: YeeE/YedE family protein [Candidatus Tectomicrobia bacterium]|uniref:YeeE/YedE family protein n=1 Tax=Tectimicrobiota bacterium TaxID=2528274 RepID=A0A932CPY8_UNCTE|nr:YeeE/YedE family protein [Candidatus Tectomicrobia bacterium]
METESLWGHLQEGYHQVMEEHWSPILGGFLLGVMNVLMFAYARPWSASDGIMNWGQWLLLKPLGFMEGRAILPPWLYSTSVINLSLILGAFASALLAREFALHVPPGRELAKGLGGGILMGIGANLAMGCTVGGFFSAMSALSMSGLGMMVGLMIGAYLGLRYLLWDLERAPTRPAAPRKAAGRSDRTLHWKKLQPYLGILVILLSLAIALLYDQLGHSERGGLFLFGLALGVINQRSRICIVRAFREPFMTGDGEHTKGTILAVAVGIIGFTILKWTGLRSPELFVQPSFWAGSVGGGIIFGVGMVLAGGCGAGTLWRMGEGQLKLWVALLGFALSGSLFRFLLESNGWMERLGKGIFLPDLIGWKAAWISLLVVLALWYVGVVWNELKGRFVLS